MSVELPVSTRIRKTFLFATLKVTTRASVWGYIRRRASSSVKEMIVFSLLDSFTACVAMLI